MSSNFQHDFFDGQYSEKKSKRSGLFHKFSNQRHLPHMKVPAEYIVVSAIAVLVLAIIAYAVGVEQGKRMALAETPEASADYETQVAENKEVIDIAVPEEAVAAPAEEKEPIEEATPIEESTDEYAVYLASFKRLAIAESEVRRLKDAGFNAIFSKKGSWFLVYVPGYKSMEEARQAKKELTGYYRDCYVRKIK
jgi:cell division septation protein DedD